MSSSQSFPSLTAALLLVSYASRSLLVDAGSKPVVQPNQQFGLCHTENVKNQPKPWPMHLSGNPNCNMIGQNKGSDEMWTYDTQGRITLHVNDAEPRPVHDRVPHVDRHHIGSSPDGARPVHEWIH